MSDNNDTPPLDDPEWLAKADAARAEGHATDDEVAALVAKLDTLEDDTTKDSDTE